MLVDMGHLHVHIHKISRSRSCQKLKEEDNRRFSIASALHQHIKDLPAPAHEFDPSSPAKSNFTRSSSNKIPVRPALPAISTMKFWDKIFRPAMRELQKREGPCCPLPEYNIRHRSSWEEVEDCLVQARERYDGDLGRRRGRFKDRCRQVADYGHVGVQAIEFAKDLEYMSVVMGIVKLLVDAAIVASRVREHARASLDLRALKRQFAQIEVLLMLHPKDKNIQEAATALVVDILEAIEEGIAFFVKPKHRRAMAAIAHGDQYQQRFLNKLESVRVSCEWLKENGHFSSTYLMIHAFKKLLEDQEANRGTKLALGQAQRMGEFGIACPRTSHLELLASRLEGGLDRLEAFGHKLESGVLRALCSISSSVSHMHGVEGQHQLSLEQEVKGQNHLFRVISEGVLSEVKMLEDESDDESEEVFSD
ncbi:hypothetical protein B0H65DRAFT_461643 [Neurospora tetraspora]|uniref:DUF7708 domain-containing protein n=1 Tax=Neurospora tetraspora TaxID=94610 RepID=A0AAE0JIK2_9PEZI|nr:hypothetical protein B0H65DRAFT_461643 [Neurospora tetraspora]